MLFYSLIEKIVFNLKIFGYKNIICTYKINFACCDLVLLRNSYSVFFGAL